jgi:opacity protein-like surface antigen
MKHLPRTLCASLIIALQVAHVAAAETDAAALDKAPPLIQVFLGVLELDDQSGEWDEISDGNVDVDFSSLPSGGIEAEYSFYQGWVHWGLNPGGSIAWKSDDTNFSGGFTGETGTTVRVDIDNSLFLFELHLGGYVRGRLTDRITTYAAAGPMVMYGEHEVEDESVEETPSGAAIDDAVDITETDSNDINLGFYGRAGVDFEIQDNQHMGFGIRYMSTELDFDKTIGKIDIEGPQYVLTYSARF